MHDVLLIFYRLGSDILEKLISALEVLFWKTERLFGEQTQKTFYIVFRALT